MTAEMHSAARMVPYTAVIGNDSGHHRLEAQVQGMPVE